MIYSSGVPAGYDVGTPQLPTQVADIPRPAVVSRDPKHEERYAAHSRGDIGR